MEGKKEVAKNCLYCGRSLKGLSREARRKYCSRTCFWKADYRKRFPNRPHKLWVHEPDVFAGAMEMYWAGTSSAAIARHYGIPAGTMYSWVHDFGWQRERAATPMPIEETPIHLRTLKEGFRLARSAEEWHGVLHDNAASPGGLYANASIILVCGRLHGYSAGKLAGIVYDRLKEDPCGGGTYAFCGKCGNAITTISWDEPIYHIERYVKTHGTFIWPDEKLGASIEVSRGEFDHLISLQKYRKSAAIP